MKNLPVSHDSKVPSSKSQSHLLVRNYLKAGGWIRNFNRGYTAGCSLPVTQPGDSCACTRVADHHHHTHSCFGSEHHTQQYAQPRSRCSFHRTQTGRLGTAVLRCTALYKKSRSNRHYYCCCCCIQPLHAKEFQGTLLALCASFVLSNLVMLVAVHEWPTNNIFRFIQVIHDRGSLNRTITELLV